MLPSTRAERIAGFIRQMDLKKLSPEVAKVVVSISDRYAATGVISDRQYEVLRKCSLVNCKRQMAMNYGWQRYYQAVRG